MEAVIFAVKYMVFVLPLFVLQEVHFAFAKFLKDRGIYDGWDKWHSFLVLGIVLIIVLYSSGVR